MKGSPFTSSLLTQGMAIKVSFERTFKIIYSTSPGKITRMTCIQYRCNIIQVTNGGDTTTVKTNYCGPF